MIETLISSKTRIKLLLKFFLNSSNRAYLRALEEEFHESTNAIRVELNRFEKAGLLKANMEGNKKYFTANVTHPLFSNLQQLIYKYVGIDSIIENVVDRLGNLEKVYITGKFAHGLNDNIIDLEFVGDIKVANLILLTEKAEKIVKRKIRYIVYSVTEFSKIKFENSANDRLLIWSI